MASQHHHCIAVDGTENSAAAFEYADKFYPKRDSFLIAHSKQSCELRSDGWTCSVSDTTGGKILEEYREKCEQANVGTVADLQTCVAVVFAQTELCELMNYRPEQRKCTFEALSHQSMSTLAFGVTEKARQQSCDDIIVGTRDMGVVGRTILGSVATSILEHADRTVVIVKQQQDL